MATPLARAVEAGERESRVTPLDVLTLARRRFLKGQRLRLAEIAQEAGVSRATLFRWVGSKELLVQEILWSFYEPIFDHAVQGTGGTGAEHVIGVHRRIVSDLLSAEPLQRFLREDTEFALRILASDTNELHRRVVAKAHRHLEGVAEADGLELPIDAAKFADILTRINRALMYTDEPGASARVVDDACTIMRLLLTGIGGKGGQRRF